jgi:hypothetical protein
MPLLIRTVLRLIPVVLLIWVGFVAMDLDGQTKVHWAPGETSPFIHGLRPSSRVAINEDIAVLTGDPVYLSITPPGDYSSALIETRFTVDGQPMVELGATVNADAGQILLKPIYNKTIESLSWGSLISGDMILWQREGLYDSMREFFDDPPSLSSIATYHAELPEDEIVPKEWSRGGGLNQTNVSLRGFHEFVTATDGRDLDIEIMYMDMNRNPGKDPVIVRAYQSGQLLAEVRKEDDGVEASTNGSLGRQTIKLRAQDLDQGVIKVELNAGTDIYWREIRSSLPRLSFLRNVIIGDEVGFLAESRQVTLFTDAQHLTAFTRHAEGVQTIRVGDQDVSIAIPHERYEIENNQTGITRIEIPAGDIVLVTDGQLAFSEGAFFNPFPVRLDDRTDIDQRGVNYILGRYESPESDGEIYESSTRFDLANLEREKPINSSQTSGGIAGSLRFVYSLPQVVDRDASVTIESIDVTFERKSRGIADVFSVLMRKVGL